MAAKKVEHSPKFEYWKNKYDMNKVRKDSLKRLVPLEVITAEEYQEITGEPYESA